MHNNVLSRHAQLDTATALLVAAQGLLREKGIEAVAMRPLADRVGITPMAIYRHYRNRAALLNAVADAGFQELTIRLQALRLRGKAASRLLQVSEIFLDAALEFPQLYQLMFLSPREGARVYPQDFRSGLSPTFNPSVAIIQEAMQSGEFRNDDAVEIAFELSALSHGLIVLYLGGRVGHNQKQFRTLYQRSFRRYVNGLRA